ncbi:MAG: transcription antitermination factor NusB [Bacteroidetes bacterium]|nr:transcription antitermination factor NusB [Bacteroidota bacterium]
MMISPRRRARFATLQALYALMLSGDSSPYVFSTTLKPRLPAQEGAKKMGVDLFEKVVSQQDVLDEIISENTKNWDVDRILRIDLIILRMAVCEFLHFDQIPPKVTMNEAIDLAKVFSTEESKDFINGVLDSIAFKLRRQGRLTKTGGGLQGWEEMVKRQDLHFTE